MNVVDPSGAGPAGTEIITLSDLRYPPLLREIHDPPDLLYVRGDPQLLLQPQLAIVGSRRASAIAQRLAAEFAGQLVAAGLVVTSGLALGIDGAAHRGALDAGGKSVGVMATGIDEIYPRRHRNLGLALAESGCLVTEFPPGTVPRKENFPQRNRIISGLSLGVLVVEAALPSGSLITAASAMEQSREVFTLPWSIAHQGGAGCLRLLRDGAKMVLHVDDIVEELASLYELQKDLFPIPADVQEPELSEDQQELAQLLGCEAVSLDELVTASGQSAAQVMTGLSELELAGRIRRCDGGYMRS